MTKPKDKGSAAAPAASSSSKTAAAVDVNAAIASGTEPANLEADAKYYCPGCGLRHDHAGTCSNGHAPIEVVSTTELKGDSDKHTAAPGVAG